MTAEYGHAPNRAYRDQQGNEHLNGGLFYDSNENEISAKVNDLVNKSSSAPVSVNAAGSHVSDGTPLALGKRYLVGAADGTKCVTLPPATGSGKEIEIKNKVGNHSLPVFAQVTDAIDNNSAGASGTSITLGNNGACRLLDAASMQWEIMSQM